MFKVVEISLSANVATNGTFTVGYPQVDGRDGNQGDFENAVGHYFTALGATFTQPDDFTLSFGANAVTVTYLGATTLPQGTRVFFQLEQSGDPETGGVDRRGVVNPFEVNQASVNIPGLAGLALALIKLGAPAAADADAACASQAITAAGTATLDGALAANGVVSFDAPRNVVAAWTGTAVMTVTGTDVYGQVVVESSASGTSLAGKKAFKTITAVDVSADVTGATVGTGDVFGLPVHLPSGSMVLKELEDGDVATAGTLAAGLSVNTASTATTADVRGTYDPNSAADGDKNFELVVALPDPDFLGNPQFAG